MTMGLMCVCVCVLKYILSYLRMHNERINICLCFICLLNQSKITSSGAVVKILWILMPAEFWRTQSCKQNSDLPSSAGKRLLHILTVADVITQFLLSMYGQQKAHVYEWINFLWNQPAFQSPFKVKLRSLFLHSFLPFEIYRSLITLKHILCFFIFNFILN